MTVPRAGRSYVVDGFRTLDYIVPGITRRVIDTKEEVCGFPVNSLEITLEVKKALNRPKDARIIAVIEELIARKNC